MISRYNMKATVSTVVTIDMIEWWRWLTKKFSNNVWIYRRCCSTVSRMNAGSWIDTSRSLFLAYSRSISWNQSSIENHQHLPNHKNIRSWRRTEMPVPIAAKIADQEPKREVLSIRNWSEEGQRESWTHCNQGLANRTSNCRDSAR